VLLPRFEGDLLLLLAATAHGALGEAPPPRWREAFATCVVLVAEGYPETGSFGAEITLPDTCPEGTFLFHGGLVRREGRSFTAGGRVLSVTALGKNLREATAAAYATAERITFPGCDYRRDIGGGEDR
ncbi:MAG: phosphoribosylamine--glycine ligase, partial [Deltaproteobacteria bacterium]